MKDRTLGVVCKIPHRVLLFIHWRDEKSTRMNQTEPERGSETKRSTAASPSFDHEADLGKSSNAKQTEGGCDTFSDQQRTWGCDTRRTAKNLDHSLETKLRGPSILRRDALAPCSYASLIPYHFMLPIVRAALLY